MSLVSGEPPEEHEGLAAFAELKRTIEAAEDLESGFLELRKWLWKNVVAHDCLPPDLPEDLKPIIERLTERLAHMHSAAKEVFDHLSFRPAYKLAYGEKLTRTEYYLLVAAGIFNVGHSKALCLSPYDDYEAFSFLHYKDESVTAYMNPGKRLGEGSIFSEIPPEEARLDKLSPEQREFFKKSLPKVYERFKR